MSEPKKNSFSIICFKMCGTCFALFVAVGILTLITRDSNIGEGAIILLIATGVTLLIGIIAAIGFALEVLFALKPRRLPQKSFARSPLGYFRTF